MSAVAQGNSTTWTCSNCQKANSCIIPTAEQVTKTGCWKYGDQCHHCDHVNYVTVWPSGETKVGAKTFLLERKTR